MSILGMVESHFRRQREQRGERLVWLQPGEIVTDLTAPTIEEARAEEAREWAAFIIHALDPHRGGYTWPALDKVRRKARPFAESDAGAASLVAHRENLRELLQEWLVYTGLRSRAFDPGLDPDDDEYASGRDLIRRTDAALSEAGNSQASPE